MHIVFYIQICSYIPDCIAFSALSIIPCAGVCIVVIIVFTSSLVQFSSCSLHTTLFAILYDGGGGLCQYPRIQTLVYNYTVVCWILILGCWLLSPTILLSKLSHFLFQTCTSTVSWMILHQTTSAFVISRSSAPKRTPPLHPHRWTSPRTSSWWTSTINWCSVASPRPASPPGRLCSSRPTPGGDTFPRTSSPTA